jgi:SP family general alpha glucoside:H+ symporter-like MFS transporter
MSSDTSEVKGELKGDGRVDVHHAEILANQDLMNDAFDGENREHEMGLWAAVKAHPWACFWAFTMCFTIVSILEKQKLHLLQC